MSGGLSEVLSRETPPHERVCFRMMGWRVETATFWSILSANHLGTGVTSEVQWFPSIQGTAATILLFQ